MVIKQEIVRQTITGQIKEKVMYIKIAKQEKRLKTNTNHTKPNAQIHKPPLKQLFRNIYRVT